MQYLFHAYFKNGLELSQPENDISSVNPEKSAFWDVLQEIDKGNELLAFALTDGQNSYLVDLRDGAFEVNGAAFFIRNSLPVTNRRLIYFRDVTHHFTQDAPTSVSTLFNLGWQGNEPDGRNVQQVIQVIPQ